MRSRLNKLLDVLERQQDLLADKQKSYFLLKAEIIHVEDQISFTMDSIIQERRKEERGRLLPVPLAYGPKRFSCEKSAGRKEAPEQTHDQAKNETEKKESNSTKVEAFEQAPQGVTISLTCFFCGDPKKEIAQIIPMPNLSGKIDKVPVCEDCWQEERERRYPNVPKNALCHCAICVARRLRNRIGD